MGSAASARHRACQHPIGKLLSDVTENLPYMYVDTIRCRGVLVYLTMITSATVVVYVCSEVVVQRYRVDAIIVIVYAFSPKETNLTGLLQR